MENANENVFNLDELFFEMVIGALNKYFANDKYDNSLIEIRKTGSVYLFSADDLIAWLRTKHGIFYYPGMEPKHAKMERIPPLTERLMDEGALNSLKNLYVRVIGKETILDSHTLIADDISKAVSVKDAEIEELKAHIVFLKNDIMDHIRQEASQNGYNLPEKVDGEPLTIERTFHELLELMRIRGEELRVLKSKCNRLNEIVKELNALNEEIKED